MNSTTQPVALPNQSAMKFYGIGKLWLPKEGAEEGTPQANHSVTFNNNLPRNFTITPGSRLYIFPNERMREGKQDAPFNVSVRIPQELFDQLIEEKPAVVAEPAQG